MLRFIISFVITACTCSLIAQTTITWKGGTPGRESAWSEPRNWDLQRVPDEFDKVVIRLENTGHYAQPVLNEATEVAWVEIQSGGLLTITDRGVLTVDGRFTYSEGITIKGGKLISDGNIAFLGIDAENETGQHGTPVVGVLRNFRK